jgi:hypothetical protein
MSSFRRLPFWLLGCLAGGLIGSLFFVGFVALFSLTPLYLAAAPFLASGASGVELFRALALPATLLGAWVGGLFGMPIGAIIGRGRRASKPARWSIPGWLTGAIVTAYVFLPNFLDPTTQIASQPVATRVVSFAILASLGALIGLACTAIRRLVGKRARARESGPRTTSVV